MSLCCYSALQSLVDLQGGINTWRNLASGLNIEKVGSSETAMFASRHSFTAQESNVDCNTLYRTTAVCSQTTRATNTIQENIVYLGSKQIKLHLASTQMLMLVHNKVFKVPVSWYHCKIKTDREVKYRIDLTGLH
jgi:hypothetical protein